MQKQLILWHRWLGIASCLLFLVWFVSGITMMYWRLPVFTPAERLETLPDLKRDTVKLEAGEAWKATGEKGSPRTVTLTSWQGEPVYRFTTAGKPGWITVSAVDGRVRRSYSWEEAKGSVPAVAGAGTRWYLEETLRGPDQWTLSRIYEVHRPLYKVRVEDAADTVLYVSSATGEVVNRTTSAGRWKGFASAILHWIYPTVLRQFDEFWRQFIIWSSLIGCVMCVAGIAVGIWRSSPSKRYRMRERGPTWSPYLGQKRWHHWGGLVFGVVTFTWALSGAFSLNPGQLSPGTAPTAAMAKLWSGGRLPLAGAGVPEWPAGTREVDYLAYQGSLYFRFHRPGQPVEYSRSFDAGELMGLAEKAMAGRRLIERVELKDYDWYYYDLKERKKNLPVWRLKFDDPEETWLYVDPKSGSIAARYVDASRRHRWIYHGLHSLDFPFLYLNRPLWDVIVIGLSLGGILLSWTGVWIGWQRLRQMARQRAAEGRIRASAAAATTATPVAGD